MQYTNTKRGRAAEIRRIQSTLRDPRPTRVLSAMGHPGYGNTFAAQVLEAWVDGSGLGLHDTIDRQDFAS